jgi:hypothetical protein
MWRQGQRLAAWRALPEGRLGDAVAAVKEVQVPLLSLRTVLADCLFVCK